MFVPILIPLLIALIPFEGMGPMGQESHFETLIEAERAFASRSVTSGTRAAFLEFLAEDAIVFDAGPVNGEMFWSAQSEAPTVLSWRPVVGGISADGGMGFTSGPWELRADADSPPARWGHFVSVWKRGEDGNWRVAADGGIIHDQPPSAAAEEVALIGRAEGPFQPSDAIDQAMEKEALTEADKAFSGSVVTGEWEEAISTHVGRGARFYRNGMLPLSGHEAIASAPAVTGGGWSSWSQRGADVSRSGDLGFTIGVLGGDADRAGTAAPWSASYYRIWTKGPSSKWEVLIDVLIPFPAAPTEPVTRTP
jgi:ketosteroid isomerase-like protein